MKKGTQKFNRKAHRLRTIPWSGLGMVLGMYLGMRWGLRNSPGNYLVYSSAGLGIGLIGGYCIERYIKHQGDDPDGQIPESNRHRYRQRSRYRS